MSGQLVASEARSSGHITPSVGSRHVGTIGRSLTPADALADVLGFACALS